MRSSTSERTVPALDRAVRLLTAIESANGRRTTSDLARELGVSKGTVHDLLETMRLHGLLDRDEMTKRYRLGPRLAQLGLAALSRMDVASMAQPTMVALAESTKTAVLLVIRQGDRAVIVGKADAGDVAMQVSATVGRRIPLLAGAVGKVLIAHAEPAERERLLAALPERDPSRLADEAAGVHTLGYAVDDEEYLAGVRAAAAPIVNARCELAAVLLAVGLSASIRASDLPGLGAATASAAHAISSSLGAPALEA